MPCDSENEDLTGLLEFIESMQPAPPAQPTIATEALTVLAYPALVLPGCLCGERADLRTDAAALLAARAKAAGPSLSFQLSTFRVQGEGGGSTTAAVLHELRPEFLPTDFHPFTTSAHLYVPATFTLLNHLLSRADALLRGKRVCELGAGLGLCSCVLGRLGPASAPSRLVVTDGCEATLPLLRANLQANCGSGGGRETETRQDEPAVETVVKTAVGLQVETALLPWGREPEPLASAFDLVVASDAIFDVRPPGAANFLALFISAAALLDPNQPEARLLLTLEPRDLLGSRWLCGAMLAAAERAGFACVEERRRRLDGMCRPDWEVDVYAFALRRE